MTYLEAIDKAKSGKVLMLPTWKGYFKWDFFKKELFFVNGDYHLTLQELDGFNLNKYSNWYYII